MLRAKQGSQSNLGIREEEISSVLKAVVDLTPDCKMRPTLASPRMPSRCSSNISRPSVTGILLFAHLGILRSLFQPEVMH